MPREQFFVVERSRAAAVGLQQLLRAAKVRTTMLSRATVLAG